MAQELTTIKVELNCDGKPMASIQGTVSYYGITPYDKFYEKPEVDDVLAEKDAEIRRLKRALYKTCANWAMAEAYSILNDVPTANRWVYALNKCRAKEDEYK